MRITALAGGVGGARFLRGLRAHLDRSPDLADTDLTVIGNTGDDISVFGLRVCPDLDTLLYTLGGGIHEGQGWGRADESHRVQGELAAYGAVPQWFALGDLDLGTHIVRSIVDAKPILAEVQPDVNNFEGWTALASWGEITRRAELGLLVSGIGYRNPDLLADMARTVDHINGGRTILGVGAGWYEKDYTTYGFDFGTVKSRADAFDEGLLRIERRFAQLHPAPLRKIPILIGGSGPKRTLPAVARHADIWHTFLPIDSYREASARVAELAAGFGRADGDIERSTFWTNPKSADDYLAAGATLFHTEVRASEGKYDLSTAERMIDWRDTRR